MNKVIGLYVAQKQERVNELLFSHANFVDSNKY